MNKKYATINTFKILIIIKRDTTIPISLRCIIDRNIFKHLDSVEIETNNESLYTKISFQAYLLNYIKGSKFGLEEMRWRDRELCLCHRCAALHVILSPSRFIIPLELLDITNIFTYIDFYVSSRRILYFSKNISTNVSIYLREIGYNLLEM